jgi:hypothetical protein
MAVKRQKTCERRHQDDLQSRLNSKPLAAMRPTWVHDDGTNKMPPKKSAAS